MSAENFIINMFIDHLPVALPTQYISTLHNYLKSHQMGSGLLNMVDASAA